MEPRQPFKFDETDSSSNLVITIDFTKWPYRGET